jgi:hypothetical protein
MALGLCWVLGACAGHAIRSDLSEAQRREDLDYLATVFAEREQSFTEALTRTLPGTAVFPTDLLFC